MATQCTALSKRVQGLCAALLLAEVTLVLMAGLGLLPAPPTPAALASLLSVIWIPWLLTLVQNYRLVRCGPLVDRFKVAPLAINRSAFPVRAAFHLAINWSALATTLILMLLIGPTEIDRTIGYLCLVATVVVWLTFNVLHRRVNRLRNLLFTTSVAAVLLLLSGVVAVR